MGAHGVGVGDEAVGLQTLRILARLLVPQLDAAAHQVDEDVQVVLLHRWNEKGQDIPRQREQSNIFGTMYYS